MDEDVGEDEEDEPDAEESTEDEEGGGPEAEGEAGPEPEGTVDEESVSGPPASFAESEPETKKRSRVLPGESGAPRE